MGRTNQTQAPQGSYTTVSDPTEPKTNLVDRDQYPPPQQSIPVQYPPPQQNPPPSDYPPPGSPMQYPPTRLQEATSNCPPQYDRSFFNPQPGVGTHPWKTGLFDCMTDPENAILTAFVPCLTFGQIAEIIDNGNTTCAAGGMKYIFGIPCLFSCIYRTKLRTKFGLVETPAPDWATHCFFELCALCQEFRELKLRGLDPAIGWQANLARSNMQKQQQMGMIPPTNQTMNY